MVKQNPGVERVDGWRELLGACGFASLHLFPFHLPSILCGSAAVSAQDPRKDGHMRQNFSSVQLLSHVQLFAIPWTAACQASLSITNSWSLLKLMSIALVCHPTISSSVFPSSFHFQSFPASGSSNESALHIRWPKYWSFSFNISASNEYS